MNFIGPFSNPSFINLSPFHFSRSTFTSSLKPNCHSVSKHCYLSYYKSRPIHASLSEADKEQQTNDDLSATSTQQESSQSVPDAGLIPESGPTGTSCTPLFPVPVFGAYNWFLNVYSRDLAASKANFCLDVIDSQSFQLSFRSKDLSESESKSEIINGIAAGNINVQNRLKKLNHSGPYRLTFLDRGGKENLLQRKTILETLPSKLNGIDDIWYDAALTYRIVSTSSAFEIREIYPSIDGKPRNPSKFEYFAMNLFPIYPLQDYSAFVCVWRLRSQTCPVAIDKRQGSVRLSFFDPLELPDNINPPNSVARFAVKFFFGAITDHVVHKQHQAFLKALAAANVNVLQPNDFRIVVESKPGQFSSKRRNEIWVQVE